LLANINVKEKRNGEVNTDSTYRERGIGSNGILYCPVNGEMNISLKKLLMGFYI
jgi:hypothetical protein